MLAPPSRRSSSSSSDELWWLTDDEIARYVSVIVDTCVQRLSESGVVAPRVRWIESINVTAFMTHVSRTPRGADEATRRAHAASAMRSLTLGTREKVEAFLDTHISFFTIHDTKHWSTLFMVPALEPSAPSGTPRKRELVLFHVDSITGFHEAHVDRVATALQAGMEGVLGERLVIKLLRPSRPKYIQRDSWECGYYTIATVGAVVRNLLRNMRREPAARSTVCQLAHKVWKQVEETDIFKLRDDIQRNKRKREEEEAATERGAPTATASKKRRMCGEEAAAAVKLPRTGVYHIDLTTTTAMDDINQNGDTER
jgi:hypothetical protein